MTKQLKEAPTFNPAITGVKGTKEGIAGAVAAWVALRFFSDPSPETMAFIIGAVGSVLMVLRNVVREVMRRYNIDPQKILPGGACLLLCAGLASGCGTTSLVKTKFNETIVDSETGDESTTSYEAVSKAGLLGTLDTSSHDWQYSWGGEENMITTGQVSEGIDNTAQVAIVDVLSDALSALSSLAQVLATVAFPAPVPSTATNVTAVGISP